jgi:phosphoserine phosphatase
MDVDSTLVQGEAIDELAEIAGVGDAVGAITTRAMAGELDFEGSLRERVAMLEGLPESAFDDVYARLTLAPGARTLVRSLKRLGYRFAIVSGGFTHVTDRLAADLDIDYARANRLEVAAGRLTGRILGDVVDRAAKAQALRDFAHDSKISVDRTIAIGDGANDLDMLAAAGLGIAFNAKPAVREAAHAAVNVPYLDTILYLLGITREDIEAEDEAHGITTPRPTV